VRVRLKGINRAVVRLADGRKKTFWYAWRGGPRLSGEPGSPDFVASYNAAVAAKVTPPAGVLSALTRYFETTSEFNDLAERTKSDYRAKIALIEAEFGDLPLAALSDNRCRGLFKEWRDRLAQQSRRQADYTWSVLSRVLSVAKDRGKIAVNPCERGGRLYSGSRRDMVWSLGDEANYLRAAPEHMRLPILLAAWTGQRQGDLLRLPWSAYDGSYIRLRQSKTGARVRIKVVGPLKEALDAAAKQKRSPLILTTKAGCAWTADGFRSSWRKACAKAGIEGLTFHDLRGTSVTRLALAGCSEPEIGVYAGLSLVSVREILDTHYLSRDPAIADNASDKLAKLAEKGTNFTKWTTKRPVGSKDEQGNS
jgi:integrase